MAAARRVQIEKPPTDAAKARMKRMQALERQRVGAKIKQARTEAGWTLRQMEARSDVSANHLSELERGLRAATVDMLVQIAFALNMTLAKLVSE